MSRHSGQSETSLGYLSYLLRLWRTQSEEGRAWRVSLEEPLTQEIVRLDSLSDLFAFLMAQTGQDPQGDNPDREISRTGAS